MNSKLHRLALIAALSLIFAGCGGTGNSFVSGNQQGTVSVMMSDAPANDWATIGVKVLSISLNRQGGGAPVSVYTAPNPAPLVNLVQLDQLSELLANASVPVGTYTSATITLSANAGDVTLTASEDPDPGFAGTAGQSVGSAQIQIQGASGSVGSRTVPLNVNFVSPLIVTTNQTNQADLEFDLSHPAFLIAHNPPAAAGLTLWAVNFNGPVHHHPIKDITRFLLRDLYATVNSVSADNNSIGVTKDYTVEPPTNPETEISSSQALTILADATNGTLFYDLDAKTRTTIFNFSSRAVSLPTKFVRVAARYQAGGKLVAVRIWASSSFDSIWANPEGHVLHADTTTNTLTVTNEAGHHVDLQITPATQFFFRTPASAQADANAIGQGTAFLSNLKRGFKVHVKVVDPLAATLQADTVDIEIARFDGSISLPTTTNFTYTRKFGHSADNYTFDTFYISSTTANGNDPLTGNPIAGFKYWNFGFPTLVTSGPNAVNSFVSATNGLQVNFGGAVGALPVFGASDAIWNDPAHANNWAVPFTVLIPSPVPLGSVAAAYSNGTGTFTMIAPPLTGTNAVPVDVNATAGSATLVYQVDRTGGILTISPVDITQPAGLATMEAHLAGRTLVKVAGLPQASGHLKAYIIFYYTGDVATMPIS
jgi:Domain of unknown function (DUF4382)